MNKPNEGDFLETGRNSNADRNKELTDLEMDEMIDEDIKRLELEDTLEDIVKEFTVLIGRMVENIERIQRVIKEL